MEKGEIGLQLSKIDKFAGQTTLEGLWLGQFFDKAMERQNPEVRSQNWRCECSLLNPPLVERKGARTPPLFARGIHERSMPFCETNPNCMIYQTAFISRSSRVLENKEAREQFGFFLKNDPNLRGFLRPLESIL
jgi:hypothetical protein